MLAFRTQHIFMEIANFMLISKKAHAARIASAKQAGLKASEVMTDQQKRDRAVAGGIAAAAKMTPEQRSERARKGAKARADRFKKTAAAGTS